MRAFLAVDVVLVLAFFAVLLMTRTGGGDDPAALAGRAGSPSATSTASGDPDPAGTGAPSGRDTSEPPAAEEPGEGVLFASPSGNIVCSIAGDAASCSIAELSDEGLVADEECTGTVGHIVRVTSEGDTERPCVTGAPPGAAPRATPVLEYEDSTSALGFTCTSSRSGIICRHDATGHGFSIARAGSSLF